MNFTVTAILNKTHKNEDGIYKIAILTIINRKKKYETTGFKVHEDDFLDGKHKTNKNINKAISQEIAKREKRISELMESGQEATIEKLNKPKNITFREYCNLEIEKYKTNKAEGTILCYEKHLKRWFNFYTGWEITPKKLDEYKVHLSATLDPNTIWNYFKNLKKFYGMALRDGLVQTNPFVKMESPAKYKQKETIYLSMDELDKLEALELPPSFEIVRDHFLLECYGGIRNSDWSRYEIEMINKRKHMIVRSMQKSKKPVIIPADLSPRLINLLSYIKPWTYTLKHANTSLKFIGTAAKINKNLTTHVGRHTFGVQCADLGISLESTAEYLGVTMKVASTYYKITGKRMRDEFAAWGNVKVYKKEAVKSKGN